MEQSFSPKSVEPYLEQAPEQADIGEIRNSLAAFKNNTADYIGAKPLCIFPSERISKGNLG